MTDYFYLSFVVYCILLSILPVLAVGFVLRGRFIMSWMKVKSSRGKYVLVRIMDMVQDYYGVGEISEGTLKFKDKRKEERTVIADEKGLYDGFGVKCVDIDDEKNVVLDRREMKYQTTYDAKKYDALISRILMLKPEVDLYTKIIIGLLVLILCLAIASAYLGFKNHDILLNLGKVAVQSTPVGGGVV